MYEDFARAQHCGDYAATDVSACDTVAAAICHADYSRCVLDLSSDARSSCDCYKTAATCIERVNCTFVVGLAGVAAPCCRTFTADSSMGAKLCTNSAGCHWDGRGCCALPERSTLGLGACLPDTGGSLGCEPPYCACTIADAPVLAQLSRAPATVSGGFGALSPPCQRCLVEADAPDGGLACAGRDAPPLPPSLIAQFSPASGPAVCTANDAALFTSLDDSDIAPIATNLSVPCQRCAATAASVSEALIAPRCLAVSTLRKLRRSVAYQAVDRLLLSAQCQPIVRYFSPRAPTCLSDGARRCHAHCLGDPLPPADARRCSQWAACGWYKGCARAFDSSVCGNAEAEANALATSCSAVEAGCTGACWVSYSSRYTQCIKPYASGLQARVREIAGSCSTGATDRATIVRPAPSSLPAPTPIHARVHAHARTHKHARHMRAHYA
jgi:hypothetical protein